MRVLVNGLSARLGGGQTYLLNLLRRVPQDNDWTVFLLTPPNLDVSGLPSNVEAIRPAHELTNPFKRAIWEWFKLRKLVAHVNCDLLFSPGGLLPQLELPPGLKTAVTFQNMLPFDREQRKRYTPGYRRLRDWILEHALSSAMRKADLVIFISEFARHFIGARLGHLSGRSVVIPHGVDAMFLPPTDVLLPRPSVLPNGDYFLYVSFIDHYKSQVEVVRAYSHVRNQTGTTAKLVLAGGEYRPYGKALRKEIRALRLVDSVLIAGNLPHQDLPALYHNSRLNLFASWTENCPNILLEMMASGRPALVSNRGPMPEFGGDAVAYFDPGNVEQLAQRWIALLTDVDLGRLLAARAMAKVSAMRWDLTASATWAAMGETVLRQTRKAGEKEVR